MPRLQAIASGAAGALALTGVHQVGRRVMKDPPRMDVHGMLALRRGYRVLGRRPPSGRRLYRQTLVGDVLSNAAYYTLVAGRRPLLRGAALGLIAGLGAAWLPERLGLGDNPARRSPGTAFATVAWYLVGGLTAGAVFRLWTARRERAPLAMADSA